MEPWLYFSSVLHLWCLHLNDSQENIESWFSNDGKRNLDSWAQLRFNIYPFCDFFFFLDVDGDSEEEEEEGYAIFFVFWVLTSNIWMS